MTGKQWATQEGGAAAHLISGGFLMVGRLCMVTKFNVFELQDLWKYDA